VLAWLSVWSEVQSCIWPSWCHCHSLSLASVKSRLVLPFWYRLTLVVPDKGPLNGCLCVFYTFLYFHDDVSGRLTPSSIKSIDLLMDCLIQPVGSVSGLCGLSMLCCCLFLEENAVCSASIFDRGYTHLEPTTVWHLISSHLKTHLFRQSYPEATSAFISCEWTSVCYRSHVSLLLPKAD